ncbi:MAG: acyl-CoA dehydrogenase family protein [Actinomycetota bacterium]
MFVDYTPEQKKLRDEARAYFETLITPEVRAKIGYNLAEHQGPEFRRIVKQMGADGWLGIGYPEEYGGRGATPIEQYIFFDEMRRAIAPYPVVTITTVGPTLLEFGSDAQRKRFIPAIVRGEAIFAIAYSEPNAGTDLASVRTRAVRDGDSYVINGQKIFTTGAHDADYLWLLARTDPEAPKHRGLSIFIVDTKLPGFTYSAINTIDGGRTNATFFEDVRVSADALVGAENEGWRLMTTQLNHERVVLACSGKIEGLLEAVREWACARNAPEGGCVIDRPWVREALARVRARTEALRLLNWRMAWEMTRGSPPPAASSAVKVFGTELFIEAYRSLMEIVGAAGLIKEGSPEAVLAGKLDHAWRAASVLTFGGGVNEVQREIIATTALGMPRGKR